MIVFPINDSLSYRLIEQKKNNCQFAKSDSISPAAACFKSWKEAVVIIIVSGNYLPNFVNLVSV